MAEQAVTADTVNLLLGCYNHLSSEESIDPFSDLDIALVELIWWVDYVEENVPAGMHFQSREHASLGFYYLFGCSPNASCLAIFHQIIRQTLRPNFCYWFGPHPLPEDAENCPMLDVVQHLWVSLSQLYLDVFLSLIFISSFRCMS